MSVEQKINLLDDDRAEHRRFLEDQLVTYIGTKRHLLDFIWQGIKIIKKRMGKEKLDIFDAFSGSGIVARFLKQHSRRLIANDLELYSSIINRCYLSNITDIPIRKLQNYYKDIFFNLEHKQLEEGLITQLYAPSDDSNIMAGERVFYTSRNARYIDTARKLIGLVDNELQHFFLAPLFAEASIHANTSGVFKGFYKDSSTGIGKFGGNNGDATKRILGDIHLAFPVFSRFECDVEVHRGDTNRISQSVKNIDVTYIDPPYNQHPYGSNYFMLNLIAENIRPDSMSKVSGIPADWNRSDYNKKKKAYSSFEELVHTLDSSYLLVSFNSEGFIRRDEMIKMLKQYGKVDVLETKYNTFRGSRNLNSRSIHVKEYLFLLEKNM